MRQIRTLIEQLRACESPGDYFELQVALFDCLYTAEEKAGRCARMVKRLARGDGLPENGPIALEGRDMRSLREWELERYVYRRIARQLRSIGDGLAWRHLRYDRRAILALSANQSPGPMYQKAGLPNELGFVEAAWVERGRFALLHDVTNCIRIGDATEFTADGHAILHELKLKPRTNPAQIARIRQALEAIANGGNLPGDVPGIRFVQLRESYRTNLEQLADLAEIVRLHGCRGMKLLPGRALVGVSLRSASTRWRENPQGAQEAIQSTRQRAIERAGIDRASHHLTGVSTDTAARDPTLPPFSIYPLHPDDCAELICDLFVFEIIASVDALVDILARAGLAVTVALPNASDQMSPDQAVLHIAGPRAGLTVHARSLNPFLFELIHPGSWSRGVAELLEAKLATDKIVPIFAGDSSYWM